MDIVPTGDELVIEARVEPTDIDVVHAGMPAQVRLTAFSQLTTPILLGTVLQVSADSLYDERTGAPFYEAPRQTRPRTVGARRAQASARNASGSDDSYRQNERRSTTC